MISEIMKTRVQVTNASIRDIYEYCATEVRKETSKNPYFSILVYSNEILLRGLYQEIMSKWYDENTDTKFQQYRIDRDKIILKFADRGNDGEVIYEAPNKPKITELAVEFENAINELNKQYEETLKANIDGNNNNNTLMTTVQEIELFNIKPELLPNDLPVRFVGYFASSVIKELFNN